MAAKRFMIAPLNEGLETDVKPWLIADSAYSTLDNAYLYYGRLRKRWGSTFLNLTVPQQFGQLYSRLAIYLGNTNGAGHLAGIVPDGGTNAAVGQIFGVGTTILGHEIFTVINGAAGAQPMLATGAGNGTFNVATGAFVINASIANAPVYWYPALPVMGITQYQASPATDIITIAFDTAYAYQYANVGGFGLRWNRLGTAVWTGTNNDFFWTTNYRNALAQSYIMFTTNGNFVTPDNIKFWDGNAAAWTNFTPIYSNTAGDTILGCSVIASFKERLLLFNTLESQGGGAGIQFANRMRWSQVGNPLAVNAFNINTTPGGSFTDLPTTEPIISVAPLKDRLILFTISSTWEVVYTNNQAVPFLVQRINSELGVEAIKSPVQFDKAVLGVGNVGIHACNGTNVERIDEKIRQYVFSINNDNEGVERVAGIRDYSNEMVYWAYPDMSTNPTFPNKILLYNYRKGNWAIFDDSITAWGYLLVDQDVQWQNMPIQWQAADFAWNDAQLQARFQSIIAGNQEGFTFTVNPDIARNAPALSITNMNFAAANAPQLTVINHNLQAGDFILIESVTGVNVADFNGQIFQIQAIVDANTIQLVRQDQAGQAYHGGGVITRVSRIDIWTKQYNFFQQDGRNSYIAKVDFNVDSTESGAVQIDYFASTSEISLVNDGADTGALLGTGVLETSPYDPAYAPLEQTQDQLWHPVYLQADGEYIQLRIYLSDAQMFDNDTALSDFELNAMTFYAEPTSTRLQ